MIVMWVKVRPVQCCNLKCNENESVALTLVNMKFNVFSDNSDLGNTLV